ncbi:MAG: enoyl-CoA hydratase-related protein [Janthinobacterium lividum]
MTLGISVTTADRICEIRFDRAAKKNAITVAMYAAMRDALRAAAADPAVRVVLFTAEGDSFTAGNDLADFLAAGDADEPAPDEAPVHGFLEALATAAKPVVAAVAGNAVGIGTTMLLHCDIVVAATTARLQVPFVNLGLVPEAASSLLLPRLVGHQRASAMVLLGEVIDAATALATGLVNRVVSPESLDAEARAVATALAAKAPTAVRLAKALLKGASAATMARMAEENRHFAAQLRSAECKEAVTAFFEKRAPRFDSA